ncbi:AimR family lysis-lysogeny pheromone receptor [Bacillus cereus]|nr:AimR family lysis-lysogeny pheromone receptor [Bacillus cereus]
MTNKLVEKQKEIEFNKVLMSNLLNRLDGERCVAGIKKKDLATHWGVSPSVVTDVFKGRTQMSFCYLARMHDLLKKGSNSKASDITDYIKSAKLENLQETMEYLALSGDFETLNKVIEKVKDKGNKEWGEVYSLLAERYTKDADYNGLYKRIKEKEKNVKSPEMNILIELILCQALYQCGNYNLVSEQLKDIKENISKITNKYIKKTFKVRLQDAISVICLQRGEIQKSRKAALEVLKACESDKTYKIAEITALGKLGESYLFEDFSMSKTYLELAISKIDAIAFCKGLEKKKEKIVETLQFLKIHHWREIEDLEKELKGMELALFLVKKGRIAEAEAVLLDLERKNGHLSDMQTFVLALVRNSDTELLKKSLRMCEENGNIFFAYLPKKELGLI